MIPEHCIMVGLVSLFFLPGRDAALAVMASLEMGVGWGFWLPPPRKYQAGRETVIEISMPPSEVTAGPGNGSIRSREGKVKT